MPTLDRRTRAPAAAAPGLQALEARSYLSFTSVAGFTIGHDAQSPTALTTVIALAADRPGNFFAAGMFRGIADLDPARNRSRTFDAADGHTYVAKYTASGKLAWAQQLPDSAVVRDVTTDRAGNLYVVGQLTGTTDFNFDQARRFNLSPRDGSWDAFVARYDSTGGLVWAARYGTGDIEDAAAIAVDGLGYVHVAGTTSDGSPGTNPFLATYSARGKSVRADTFGDTFDTTLVDLAAAPAGDVYLAGVNYRATTFSAGGVSRAVSDNTAYLLKVDPRGRLAWIDGFDPFHDDTASLAADDAGVYLAGYDSGADLNPARSKTYTLDNGGGYLAKYSTSGGGLAFARPISDDFSTEADHLALDPATGNVLMTGVFNDTVNFNPSGPVFRLNAVGGVDAFLARYDRGGRFLTAANFGTIADEEAPLLAAGGGGRVVIGRDLSRPTDFEPGPRERILTSDADDPLSHQAAYLVVYTAS